MDSGRTAKRCANTAREHAKHVLAATDLCVHNVSQ